MVLTKADQCSDVANKHLQVQALDQMMMVHTLNALEQSELPPLASYCTQGKTIAFMGSSGVGNQHL